LTDGTVIATFSRRMHVERDDGSTVNARIKGKKLKPVCGDRVMLETLAGEQDMLITAIGERKNELARPNVRGQREVLAANVELVVVVAAASPKADWFIVDRYLCAAELMRVPACIVFNKIDLYDGDEQPGALDVYRNIGLAALATSAESGSGLDALARVIGEKTAIIVGQSGVGKSSLINRLAGNAQLPTAELSDKTGEGRHTTVNSAMIQLPGGGRIIDSPGVRDFGLWHIPAEDIARSFVEFREYLGGCRFRDCTHHHEPDCALRAAVDDGHIQPRRLASYHAIVAGI